MTNLGDKIKAARKKANMTQAELATKIGISTMCISHYEKAKRTPKVERVKEIADALGVNMADLYEEVLITHQSFWTPIKREAAPVGEAIMVTILRRCEGSRLVVAGPVYKLKTTNKKDFGFYEFGDETREIGPEYFQVIAWARYPEPYTPEESEEGKILQS